jgi:hypothetical protein
MYTIYMIDLHPGTLMVNHWCQEKTFGSMAHSKSFKGLPPELRFIGSVVEDLAKKDFNFLREHENRANNQTELKKYSSVVPNIDKDLFHI